MAALFHSYVPIWVTKAVKIRDSTAIGAWWYPEVRSNLPKILGLLFPTRCSISLIFGKGQLIPGVQTFRLRKSIQNLHPVEGLCEMLVGAFCALPSVTCESPPCFGSSALVAIGFGVKCTWLTYSAVDADITLFSSIFATCFCISSCFSRVWKRCAFVFPFTCHSLVSTTICMGGTSAGFGPSRVLNTFKCLRHTRCIAARKCALPYILVGM